MVGRVKKFFSGTYLGLMLLFLYAPILILIIFSFNESRTLGNWTGFTFDWYTRLFSTPEITDALGVTVSVAMISAVAATALGTAAAIGLHAMKRRPRAIIENISQLPMVNPDLVTGISLMLLFLFIGLRDGYTRLFSTPEITDALGVTVSVAMISAVAATALGTAAAIGLHAMKRRPRAIIENISQLPMVNPDLVTGISLMLLFLFIGLRDGYTRLVIAHITFNLPYVIFSVLPKLRQSSDLLYEAALDLGCTPMRAIWNVVIPDIMPGIVSGFILAFTLSIDDFVVSFFAGNGVDNLSMYIYASARRGVNPALSTIIFVPVVTLLLIVNLRSIRQERQAEIQSRKVKMKR